MEVTGNTKSCVLQKPSKLHTIHIEFKALLQNTALLFVQ